MFRKMTGAIRQGVLALIALAITGALLIASPPAVAADYAVIVNANNPDAGKGAAMKEVVKRLFLKEQTSWPGGPPAKPLARPASSPAQQAFVAEVLGMDQAALDQHWLHLKQTKGETPPRAVGSALILTRLVGKYPGAFSVVTAEEAARLPDGVAVLFRFSH